MRLRSNENGDPCLILAAEVDPEGWYVTALHKHGTGCEERRQDPG